jgi:hypothetical protein
MSVARCGCPCADCCGGFYPAEFDVTITLRDRAAAPPKLAGICDNCENLGGTFTLAHDTSCTWKYDSGITLSETCDSSDGDDLPILQQQVELGIYCSNPTTYGISLSYTIWREAAICPGYSPTRYDFDRYFFALFVPITDFFCSSASSVAIPIITPAGAGIQFRRWLNCSITPGFVGSYLESYSGGIYDSSIAYYCEQFEDAHITAVP